MNTLTCYLCGGHTFYAVEFRNTKTIKIIVGQEEVDLVCPHCGRVIYQIRDGRAERVPECRHLKLGHRIKVWLKHFKGNPEEK